jgi:hypothetical protein
MIAERWRPRYIANSGDQTNDESARKAANLESRRRRARIVYIINRTGRPLRKFIYELWRLICLRR